MSLGYISPPRSKEEIALLLFSSLFFPISSLLSLFQMPFIFALFAAIVLAPMGHAQWSLDSTPLWADFGHNGVEGNPCPGTQCELSPSQASFIANTYKIVSLEKCFGIKWGSPGNKTELNFMKAVGQLKAANPNVKVRCVCVCVCVCVCERERERACVWGGGCESERVSE